MPAVLSPPAQGLKHKPTLLNNKQAKAVGLLKRRGTVILSGTLWTPIWNFEFFPSSRLAGMT